MAASLRETESTVQDIVLMDAVACYNKMYGSAVESLKDMQQKAVTTLTSGKDCICSLPTGYGKSLIYELLPFVDKDCLVVIIAPLNAIIKQQIQKLGERAMSSGTMKNLEKLKNKEINYIFSHPEDILQNEEIINVFTSDCFSNRNIYLVVDEAHCILQWGDEFRPDFKKLSQLRSIFKCHVLALSATVTESGQKEIMKSLLMNNCEIICASPAKDNISLIVKNRPSPNAKGNNAQTPYEYVYQPILTDLKENLDNFPITIIYCKSMQWIGFGYEMAREILEDCFYVGENTAQNARVVMFHSSMEKSSGKLKDMILESLQGPEEECKIRLIISSVALGMGADLRHVKRVIHAGPPTNLETYVQEIGRAGRAGAPAQAILYFNSMDVASPHMRQEMKDYCKSEQCKREIINKHFGFHAIKGVPDCCNICEPPLGLEWEFQNLSIA